MLNPNNRANTIISQSFIASEFQGYSDPFTKAEPTSSLNQFVRSKQTSDSGFIQEGENQSFGFGNITTNNEPKQLESFSRKANEPQVVVSSKVEESRNRPRLESYDDQNGTGTQNVQKQQFMQVPQQFNQRYVSPNVMKTDSPTKQAQFAPQAQRPSQQYTNQQPISPAYNQPSQKNNFKQQSTQGSFKQQSTQGFSNQQSRPQVFSQQSRPQSFSGQSQYSQQLGNSQLGSSQLNGQRPSMQQTLESQSVGKRLKLNVSQEFSNSFVLKCVNEPQKSSILSMKQRQRDYRKSIQNFFV